MLASENYDSEAMQSVVTDSFRRPFYEGDPTGTGAMNSGGVRLPEQDVWTIEDFEAEYFETDTAIYDVDTIGDPIIQGDGPLVRVGGSTLGGACARPPVRRHLHVQRDP